MLRLLNDFGWPIATGVLLALLITANPFQNTPDTTTHGQHSYQAAVQSALPSVVNIYTQRDQARLAEDPLYQHYMNRDHPWQQRMKSSLGSGVIIRNDGHILTNHHVVSQADEILVRLYDGRETSAQLIGSDPETDLAVLKINLDNLAPMPVSPSDKLHVGDIALAIGNPFGFGQSVSQGIVSAIGRYGLGLSTYENFIQTDAAINPGNSGGALVNSHGELLGINTAILDTSGGSVGIGFAIPAHTALQILNELIQHGQVVRGWLGVRAQQLAPDLAQSLHLQNTNGVVITGVYLNGPAHLAGIQPGDVITHIDELPVGDGRLGMNQVAASRPGQTVNITLIRQGLAQQREVLLGSRPTTAQ